MVQAPITRPRIDGSARNCTNGGIREAIDRYAAPVVADSVQVVAGQLKEQAEVLGGVALVQAEVLGASRSG
jgi:hypothetical protein